MIRILLALSAAAAFLLPSPAFAWGEYGHRTVAAIAMDNISPHSRAVIRRLLKAAPLLGTPDCALKSIGDASVWPDCIRRDRDRWGYTSPWHYQNVDICEPFALEPNCPNGNCAYAQVERNMKILSDKSLPDNVRLEALAFLVHFTGDLPQPMHAGDRHDRGVRGGQACVRGKAVQSQPPRESLVVERRSQEQGGGPARHAESQ